MKKHLARKSNRKALHRLPPALHGRQFETLEARAMMAADAAAFTSVWQNPGNSRDVDNDGEMTPLDVLLIINELNRSGSRSLDNSVSVTHVLQASTASTPLFYDVNGDGFLAPDDVLQVIDFINLATGAEEARISLVATDMAGNVITSIAAGTDFRLSMQAEDIRADAAGIFAAYADVTFDSTLVSYNPNLLTGRTLTFDPDFVVFPSGTLNTGVIDEAGATKNSLDVPASSELVTIWTVTLTATTSGLIAFVPNPADQLPAHNTLVYSKEAEVDPNIEYVGTTLTAVAGTTPSLDIADTSVNEGDTGTTNVQFTVMLSQDPTAPVSVIYATSDGTASGGSDYVSQSLGTLTFLPGDPLTKTINVAVNGDTTFEGDETFNVNLLFASNATIDDGVAQGTIIDDDEIPTLSIVDSSVVEGDSGTVNMVFTVTLTGTSDTDVTVSYATQFNTAISGVDYSPQSGVLTFAPGDTTKQILVPVIGDLLSEGAETFFINLSSQVGAALPDAQAIGTIIDNDAQGFLISNAAVLEGDSGTKIMTFTVTLSAPQALTTTVQYATLDDTATAANNDYVPTAGTLTFAQGATSATVSVVINGDTVVEPDETFKVLLTNATNTIILNANGVGTIFDDDGTHAPDVTFRFDTDVPGPLNVNQNFTLQVHVQDVRPGFDPAGVLAAYLDVLYSSSIVAVNGPISFNAPYGNSTSGSTVTPGLLNEVGGTDGLTPLGDGEFLLFSVPMRTISSGQAIFTGDPADGVGHSVRYFDPSTDVPLNRIDFGSLTLDVGQNSFQVTAPPAATEGNSGTKNFTFTVTRFKPDNNQALVTYTTTGGTATTADSDFVPVTATLTFNGNATGTAEVQTVTIQVNGDLKNEADETFNVVLSNATNGATIGQGTASATILNDDAVPTVSIADGSGSEGGNVSLIVSLSTASGQTVLVPYSTAANVGANAATPGSDFTTTSGTLTFAAGITQQTILVPALSDITSPENAETFLVNLGVPTNATVVDGVATGTILDAPPAGIGGLVYLDVNNDGIKQGTEAGIAGVVITLANQSGTLTQSVVTTAQGTFQFLNLPPNIYTVTQTQPGFYVDGQEVAPALLPAGVTVIANDTYQIDTNVANATTETFFLVSPGKNVRVPLLAV